MENFRSIAKGPIPAGTGETSNQPSRAAIHRAYPRRHGGNNLDAIANKDLAGLSPQARGKLFAIFENPDLHGPIPAGTGETE